MKLIVEIPEEQIEKSLAESRYINEDEGEKCGVNIVLLYTNGRLEFVDVSRKTDFYSCKFQVIPQGYIIGLTRELDKTLNDIRAEIDGYCSDNRDRNDGLYIAMKIIDKYRTEWSE